MQQDAISAFRKNLNDLEEIVMQAKRVPLSNMCMVDRERILGLANAITTDLPTVFAECEGVVQNQITIISEANERAEQTKQNATMRANQYVTDAKNQAQQMTAQAQQQAQEMLKKAQQQAAGMVREAQEQARIWSRTRKTGPVSWSASRRSPRAPTWRPRSCARARTRRSKSSITTCTAILTRCWPSWTAPSAKS